MFIRPSLTTIRDRIKKDLEDDLKTVGSTLKRSLVGILSTAISGAVHLLHGHISFISEQIFPDKAIKKYLVRWTSIWNVPPIKATYASGYIRFTGTEGKIISTGNILKRSDNVEFYTLTEGTISSGIADVEVQAVKTGAAGNCSSGIKLNLLAPIAGIDSMATVNETEITGGNDEELEDSNRARLIERIQKPPMGGALRDYEKWAKEVAGVTRVWPYSNYFGSGTVGVMFVRDNDDDIFPDSSAVEDVQNHIEEERPVTANAVVFAPQPDPIDFTITLLPNTSETREAVRAALEDLIYNDGEPGGTILLSRMNEAISTASGESDHILISPNANYVSEDGYLPTLGDITFQ